MRKNKERTNNKGFSLVELIIVIAIMAVLIGVLAPQFIRYVERSRQSTDKQNVASIVTSIQVYAIDPENTADAIADGDAITLSTTAAPSYAPLANHITDALTDAGIDTSFRLRSGTWNSNAGTITLTVNVATDGTVTITSDDTDIFE